MNFVRPWIRRVVPLPVRQAVAQQRRRWRDFRGGVRLPEVRAEDLRGFGLHAEVRQPVMPSAMFANKLANLVQGARRVHLSVIAPGATWSFWRHVGEPRERNGFVEGRNLVNGALVAQVGGGLCQLSSLVYHLALLAGLRIVERHAHSIDIYHEHERFTPLGADATVVWGAKDLRIANPHGVDVVLECFVENATLVGRVHARGALPKCEIAFVREPVGSGRVRVATMVNGRLAATTSYEQKQGLRLEQ